MKKEWKKRKHKKEWNEILASTIPKHGMKSEWKRCCVSSKTWNARIHRKIKRKKMWKKWKSNKPMKESKKGKNNVASKQNENSWRRIGMTASKIDDRRAATTNKLHTARPHTYVHYTYTKWMELKTNFLSSAKFIFCCLIVVFVRWLFGKLSQFCWLSLLLVEQYLSMKLNCCRCVYSARLIVVATRWWWRC